MKRTMIFMLTAMFIISACKRTDDVKPSLSRATPDTATLVDQSNPPVVPIVVAGLKDHAGLVNAGGTAARFNTPTGIFVNTDGSLLVGDKGNRAVRKIVNSVVSTVVKNANLTNITDLAAARDGTIAIVQDRLITLFKNGLLNFLGDNFCVHCTFNGIDKSADGIFFWYSGYYGDGEGSSYLNAKNTNGIDINNLGGDEILQSFTEYTTSVSTALNDNKFIISQHQVFEYTHSGTVYHVLPNTTFTNLTDIVANKDGTKLYLVDNGDIKVITRCTTCRTLLSVLIAHIDASHVALSNSEKVLFFTSNKHHTVNKINLL